jgi:DNA-binding XRE family transcriptional regulator
VKGNHIKILRKTVDYTQEKMAGVLNVSTRTIAKWETEGDNPIAPIYASICQTTFENLILAPVLRDCTKKIFQEVAAELVAIWLVRYSIFPLQYDIQYLYPFSDTNFWELILHENTARYQCLCNREKKPIKCNWYTFCDGEQTLHNDRVHKNLQQKSLTTFPLQSGQILNLAGENITNHSNKRIPGRRNPHYNGQTCHSLLHVPYHIPHVSGPRPVALFSLQNKLEKDEHGKWRVMDFPKEKKETEETEETAFTEEDERRVTNIVKKLYEEKLKGIIDAFDYLPDSQ